MGHQPFEQWILEDKNKTPQEELLLNQHLSECQSCSALENSWNNVEREIKESNMVNPLPGFLDRWKITLYNKKAIEHQMQAIKTFIGISITILLTIGALFTWIILTNSVSDIIVGGLNIFTSTMQAFINLRAMIYQFLRSAPPFTPYLFWILVAAWGIVLSGFWGLTIWRVSRQGVRHNEETN